MKGCRSLVSCGNRMGSLCITTITFIILYSLFALSNAFADCSVSSLSGGSTLGATSIGQSFTPTCSGTISSITAKFSASATGRTLTLYSGSGNTGSVVCTQTSVSLSSGVNVISITSTCTVTSGATYTFLIDTSVSAYYSAGNPYSGGALYWNGNSTSSNLDLYFAVGITESTTTTATVPLMTDLEQFIYAFLAGLGGIYTIIRARVK